MGRLGRAIVLAFGRLPRPPFCDRLRVLRVVAVCIDTQPMAEARFGAELVLRSALDEIDEPPVGSRPFAAAPRRAAALVFRSVIRALKPLMPPCAEYRGGVSCRRMSGRYFSVSSSHVVTCARMSLTDHSPETPGSISWLSDKPAYDSWNARHAFSSRCRSCCLSTPTLF